MKIISIKIRIMEKYLMFILFIAVTGMPQGVYGQKIELNDPQIISILKTMSQIDLEYSYIGKSKRMDNSVDSLIDVMIKKQELILDEVYELENHLILSPQPNIITRILLLAGEDRTSELNRINSNCNESIFVGRKMSYYKKGIFIIEEILIPQAKNKILRQFLSDNIMIWECLYKMIEEI